MKGSGMKYENKGKGELIVFMNSQMIRRLKILSGRRGKASIQVLLLCVVIIFFSNLYHLSME